MCSNERKLIWRKTSPFAIISELLSSISAHVAELVDAHGSGPCAARCGGSSPSVGTTYRISRKAADFYESAAFFIGARKTSIINSRARPRLVKRFHPKVHSRTVLFLHASASEQTYSEHH